MAAFNKKILWLDGVSQQSTISMLDRQNGSALAEAFFAAI